jgi:putative oxidoreductase
MLFPLMFRVAVGDVFFSSGLSKIASWDITLLLFRDEYRVPLLPVELAAILATTIELVCPVFLVLGLASRLAALPMLGATLVIQIFVYPESWNQHLMWAAMLLYVLTRGPGSISLDHLIARRLLDR